MRWVCRIGEGGCCAAGGQDEQDSQDSQDREARPDSIFILPILLILSSTRGVVWKLAFGSWVLLQPERINAYSQVLKGDLDAFRLVCLVRVMRNVP